MASITANLLGQLNLSTAEKAFRPWWDDMENFLVYSMIIISILVAPGGFILTGSNNIDCNRCQGSHCCDYTYLPGCYVDADLIENEKELNAYFVRRFCENNPVPWNLGPHTVGSTSNGYEYGYSDGLRIPTYIIYFQYFLLAISAILIVLDRPFVIILFRSLNIEQVYNLLVVEDPYQQVKQKDKLERKTYQSKKRHEIVSCMGAIGSYFTSYLTRTVLSIVASLAILSFIIFYQMYNYDEFQEAFICIVHERWYECSGHATGFYLTVGWIFASLLIFYCLLNIYNLVWIISSGHFSPLDSVMKRFKTEGVVSPCLTRLYYGNRNVKLLLCLLSTSSGMSAPLRALALVDRKLRQALIPTIQVNNKSYDQQGRPKTQLKIELQPNSLLGYVSKRKDCYVTFCIENGLQVENFTETCSSWDMTLEDNEKSDGVLRISTSLNGLIISVTEVDLNSGNGMHQGITAVQLNGKQMENENDHIINAWQRVN